MIIVIILIVLLIAFYLLYKNEQNKKQKRLEELLRKEEQIKKEKDELSSILSQIEIFNLEYKKFLKSDKFISNYDLYIFKEIYDSLFNEYKTKKYSHLPDYHTQIVILDNFSKDYSNLKAKIELRNNEFIKTELLENEELLSNIEGKSLDLQQRNAILIDQDNSLIIAGAGSGKTTTIAGKVKYLTQKLGIKENEILLISFTRKSADEMIERIQDKMNISLPVKTFHKLGLDIIAETNNEKPSIFSLSQKETLEFLASIIKNAKSNKEYFKKIVDFFTYYLKPYKDIDDFKSDSEHNNYLKEQKFEGYKITEKKRVDGSIIKYRERFKSQEEVLIANFLFRNNIQYEYEEKYKYKTASKNFGQYKPDFYLPEYEIYIEHFGINENGNVPDWFKGDDLQSAQEKYTNGITWKRNEHIDKGSILIETYSWEQKKGILTSNLQKKLEEKNVIFNPISDEQLWDYIFENTPEDIDVFTQLINTFLVLFKSNNETIINLEKKAKKDSDKRALLFLEIFKPILDNYENFLIESNEIDFSDMINLATEIINNNQFISPYKYIIIDEFQDISISRYQLIKALLNQNPSTKLFCVGDDWQSIYRFAGSDIGIFTNFNKLFKSSSLNGFERNTQISYIENTYRFDNQIIELSGNFILKNPNQITKTLKSNKQSNEKPFFIHSYIDPEKNGKNIENALHKVLKEISSKEKDNESSVLLLGRYDFEKRNLENPFISRKFNNKLNRYEYCFLDNKNIKIEFLTVHKSKGLESDYVVILNGNSGTFGFPSEINDDPLLNFLLSKADQFPNGEERRLFYVALTRAKKQIHILSNSEFPSKFISEIDKNETVTKLKCDWCDNGKLIERNGPFGYFYACNNVHYCNFTRKIESGDLNEIGVKHYKNEDFDNAIKYFQKSLELESLNPSINYNLARTFESIKKFDEALQYYNIAIQNNYKDSFVYFKRGMCLYNLEKFDESINDFLYLNNFYPNDKSVNLMLSMAYYKTDRMLEALYYIDKEIELDSTNKRAIDTKKRYLDFLRKSYSSKEVKISSFEINEIKEHIDLAINFDLNIKFNYHKSEQFDGGLQSLRTIKPIEFSNVGNSLCLVGFCYMRKENRTFNIDRIANLIINPSVIEYWSEN